MFKLILLLCFTTVFSSYVPVPGKGYIHEDCVYSVPSLSFTLQHFGDNLKVITSEGEEFQIPPCSYSPYHGPAWKTWAQYQNPQKITYLTGEWVVPPPPTDNGAQILYYWNGVEPTDNSAVLQPVLQYGETPAGGGQYWGLASWYVSDTHGAFFTKLITVNPGDVVLGSMSLEKNSSWVVTGQNTKTNEAVSFTYKPYSGDYTWAYEVLEAYSISNCDQYPTTNGVYFSNIKVAVAGTEVKPAWVTMTKNTFCGENTKVISAEEVEIVWAS
eukprot:TRINITY_DN3458_c0_g1_i1.p1 TRINITY_DN3458_c0_g1~~TRINITY_DN3458_c0_g1_i1.p1  ORF type:complete len:281 (-),score=54.64 TRINITY_DN3458_c0_g1_i1:30-842(-)